MALFDEDGGRIPDEEAYGRLWMRNRENHWWQDLGMQDAGWTYEFFDGSLLLPTTCRSPTGSSSRTAPATRR